MNTLLTLSIIISAFCNNDITCQEKINKCLETKIKTYTKTKLTKKTSVKLFEKCAKAYGGNQPIIVIDN